MMLPPPARTPQLGNGSVVINMRGHDFRSYDGGNPDNAMRWLARSMPVPRGRQPRWRCCATPRRRIGAPRCGLVAIVTVPWLQCRPPSASARNRNRSRRCHRCRDREQ